MGLESWFGLSPAVVLGQVVVATIFGGVCVVSGARCLGRLSTGDLAGDLALGFALGSGLLGTACLLLASVGRLSALGVGLVLAIGVGIGWRSALELYDRRRELTWPNLGLIAALLAPGFVLALYPPTGWDATTYHLPFARAFADTGSAPFLEYLRFPVFPQLQEMLFAAGLLLGGELVPAFWQWMATSATLGLVWSWAQSQAGRSSATWASALWLGTPLVVWIGASPYVDAGLTLHVTAALVACERWLGSGRRGWLLASALSAGFACGDKYLGLFFVGALVLVVAEGRRRWTPVLLFGALAVAAAAPWHARIVSLTGNPVFPFYATVFGDSEWQPAPDRGLPEHTDGVGGWVEVVEHEVDEVVSGLGFLAATPWRAVFDREVFDRQAPLSPWWIPGSLFLLIPGLIDARTRRWAVVVVVYCLFWLTTIRDLRFLMPILPAAAVVVGAAIDRLVGAARSRRVVVLGVAAALVAPGWAYGWFKVIELGPIPVRESVRERYLAGRVPGSAAVRWLEERHGENYRAYGLYGERLHGLSTGTWVGSIYGPWRYERLLASARQGEAELWSWLSSEGCDYIVVIGDSAPSWFDRLDLGPPVFHDADATVWEVPALASR